MTKDKFKRILMKKIGKKPFLKLLSLLSALMILIILYKKGVIAPMFINGQAITIRQIYESYKEGGYKGVTDRLLLDKFIDLESKRRNIVITSQEMEVEIKQAEKEALENGKTLNQILNESDQSLSTYEKNLKVRLTIYKILSESVNIDDQKIDEVIEESGWLFKDDKEAETVREELRKYLIDSSYQKKYQSLIKEAKANFEINYIINFKI